MISEFRHVFGREGNKGLTLVDTGVHSESSFIGHKSYIKTHNLEKLPLVLLGHETAGARSPRLALAAADRKEPRGEGGRDCELSRDLKVPARWRSRSRGRTGSRSRSS